MCIPIPIIFGCPTSIKPENDASPRQCPRCHNVAVVQAKRSTWFELFWIPLIPLSRKHILLCTICQWSEEAPKDSVGQDFVGEAKSKPISGENLGSLRHWDPPNMPGYRPVYVYGQQTPKT